MTFHETAFEKASTAMETMAGPASAAAFTDRANGRQRSCCRSGGADAAGDRPLWFRIGSLTKTLVAFAALDHAYVTGHDLDADIRPDLPGEIARGLGRPVGLIPVLTHTAGLRNCASLNDATPEEALFPDLRFDAAVGWFSYSNVGYALAGAWIGRRTGLDFADWLALHGLAPLSLTGIAPAPPKGAAIAQGHVRDPETGRTTPFDFRGADERFAPAGFLWGTTEGLSGLMAALLNPPSGRASRVVAAMTSMSSLPFGPNQLAALPGLFRTKRDDRPVFFNEGEIGGFRARMEFDLVAGTGLATMSAYSGPENARSGAVLAEAASDTTAFPSPALLRMSESASYIAGGLGLFECEAPDTLRAARLNGIPARLKPCGPRTWTGQRQDGRPLLVHRPEGAGGDVLSINGHLALACRQRNALTPFDPCWFGRYLNGYRIDVAASKGDGAVTVSSDYSGLSGPALVLGPRTLATDMGIAVFRERSSRAELRLLGTATFRALTPGR